MHPGIAELCAVGTSRDTGKSTAFEAPYGQSFEASAHHELTFVDRLQAQLRHTKALLRSEGERAERLQTEAAKQADRGRRAEKRAHDNLWIGGVLGMAAGVLFSTGLGLL